MDQTTVSQLLPLEQFVLDAAKKNVKDTGIEWFSESDIAEEAEVNAVVFRKPILKTFKIILKRLCKKGLIEPHKTDQYPGGGGYYVLKGFDIDEPSEEGITKELDAIKAAMAADDDLAWTWHCNLACCYMNEGACSEAANKSAAGFMKLAFGVDVTQFSEYKSVSAWKNQSEGSDPVGPPEHPVRFESTSAQRPAGWRFREQALDHCAYAIVENAGSKHQRFLSYSEDGCGYQTVIRTTFTPSKLAKIPADLFTLSTTLHPVKIDAETVPTPSPAEAMCEILSVVFPGAKFHHIRG